MAKVGTADAAAYATCKEEVRQDYVTATSAISFIATFLMGLFANLPLGLAPGLGVNAYFAYTVVGFDGTGLVPYGQALAAVFLEGWLFFALSVLGLRQWLGRLMPRSLTLATGAGIGMYLAFIGLGPNGLNVVGGNAADLVGRECNVVARSSRNITDLRSYLQWEDVCQSTRMQTASAKAMSCRTQPSGWASSWAAS